MSLLLDSVSKILLFDGATGTQLQQYGLKADECPELCNDTHPDRIRKLYVSYKQAGSQVIQTNTFGANRIKLKKFGLESKVAQLNEKAVRIAREVMGEDGLVSASIGPTGDFLKPYGSLTFDELYDVFAEQIQAVAQAGADIINIETMMDISEARIALLASLENTKLPTICSFTFEKQGRTLMGSPPNVLVEIVQALGAAAVGANCSGGPDELLPIIVEMKKYASVPLLVQPNAGLPTVVDGKAVYPLTPEAMAKASVKLVKAGANILGGCCGTTPEHIRHMAKAVDRLEAVPPGRLVEECICSKYQAVPISDVQDRLLGLKVSRSTQAFDLLDKILSSGIESPVPLLSFDDSLSADEIRKALAELESLTKQPLAFELSSDWQAEAALRQYSGRAGVVIKENRSNIEGIAQKYGAVIFEQFNS